MTSAIDRLNDDLYHAGDSDLLFVIRWPPNMNENAVTKHELLNDLHPAPLPPLPPIVEPPPVPVDTLVITASSGLTIRDKPSPTGTVKGLLEAKANGAPTEVDVQGHYAAKTADGTPIDYGQLLRVNGLKYADTGFIARSKGGEVYLSLKA